MLGLVGGDEFKAGNEEQDQALVAAAADGVAFVVPTAAGRMGPEKAVANAHRWFRRLGLTLEELPVLTPSDAKSQRNADLAATGGFFYLVGGDPGLVVRVLARTPVWAGIRAAWERGAVLAGSSAGAMALARWTLIRARFPGDSRRRAVDALGVVPQTAVLPHYDTFGHRWVPSAQESVPDSDLVLAGIDERSAALWDGSVWRAKGPGTVTLVRGDERSTFRSGEIIEGLPAPEPG